VIASRNQIPRECIACHRSQTPLVPRKAEEPNVLAVSLYITFRDTGKWPKRRTRSAGSIRICEQCLEKALRTGALIQSREALELLKAAQVRLTSCYSTLLEEEPEAPCR